MGVDRDNPTGLQAALEQFEVFLREQDATARLTQVEGSRDDDVVAFRVQRHAAARIGPKDIDLRISNYTQGQFLVILEHMFQGLVDLVGVDFYPGQ